MSEEQAAFCKAVESNLRGLEAISSGICAGCPECQSDYGDAYQDDDGEIDLGAFGEAIACQDVLSEGSFSSSECDSCGSVLAGDRHVSHAIIPKNGKAYQGEIIHLQFCVDCLLYHANGDLPEFWSVS